MAAHDAKQTQQSRLQAVPPVERKGTSCARLLLKDANLNPFEVGFLEIALQEAANLLEASSGAVDGRELDQSMCINELLAMHSMHRRALVEVVHAVTGLRFRATWQGQETTRLFRLHDVSRVPPMERTVFDALHASLGWGSDAHRVALGAIPG